MNKCSCQKWWRLLADCIFPSSFIPTTHNNFQCRRKSFQNQKWYIIWLRVNITFINNLFFLLSNAFKQFVLNLDCEWSCARTEYFYHFIIQLIFWAPNTIYCYLLFIVNCKITNVVHVDWIWAGKRLVTLEFPFSRRISLKFIVFIIDSNAWLKLLEAMFWICNEKFL